MFVIIKKYGGLIMNKITKKLGKRIASFLLSFVLIAAGICSMPKTVHAAGWTDVSKDLTLGETVHDNFKLGDYIGLVEAAASSSSEFEYYWHVYKFTMPKTGLLDIFFETAQSDYFKDSYYFSDYRDKHPYNGFAVFSTSNTDKIIWRCDYNNQFSFSYNASREMYYGSTQISLEEGEYYFAVRRKSYSNTPYYLTLSYQEPIIHTTSIALDKTKLKMEVGDSQQIKASVLPNNATNKNIVWRSTSPSVATVKDGLITAVSSGTASIVATSEDGVISAVCEVTVMPVNEGFEYRILEDKSAEVTKFTGKEKDVVIPSLMGDSAVSSIGNYTFQNCGSIESVEIPEGITTIGDCAFQNCGDIKSVKIPESITTIGDYAFQNCESLTDLYIFPANITEIGNYAFQNCNGLIEIGVPIGVTRIGYAAFYGCSGLTSIKVDVNNTVYDSRDNCNAVIKKETNTLVAGCQNTVIPDSVTSIGDMAFSGSSGLTSITIPESVTEIGSFAFKDCSNLTTIKGIRGSYAEEYANENGYEFVEIESNIPDEVRPTSMGDVNGDGKVNLNDAKLVLKVAVGIDIGGVKFYKALADIDNSGKIDLNDAKIVLRMAVGIS